MPSSAPSKPTHLAPSKLGTKEYWDSLYTTEITNHSLDPSDEGTIWFDDSAAEDKIIAFLEDKIEEGILGTGVGKENCSFLDLGMGNGHFLGRLREGEDDDDDDESDAGSESKEKGEEEVKEGKGWGGRMLGVDYSEQSVEFARRIAKDKNHWGGREVEFLTWDVLNSEYGGVLSGEEKEGWDVVLDKGTFDAICLSEEVDAGGRRICEGYRERVVRLVKEGGVLLITSCNWTEEELEAWFVGDEGDGKLEVLERIKYPSFVFGGRKGQTISSVCFVKMGLR